MTIIVSIAQRIHFFLLQLSFLFLQMSVQKLWQLKTAHPFFLIKSSFVYLISLISPSAQDLHVLLIFLVGFNYLSHQFIIFIESNGLGNHRQVVSRQIFASGLQVLKNVETKCNRMVNRYVPVCCITLLLPQAVFLVAMVFLAGVWCDPDHLWPLMRACPCLSIWGRRPRSPRAWLRCPCRE